MDLLKPWISATVSAALKNCSYARSATKDGELVIPRDKESVAQLISIDSESPGHLVAAFSDGSVKAAAEFTEPCLSDFVKERGPLGAKLRGDLFKLKCRFVVRNNDAAVFEDGVTLRKQLKVYQPATSFSKDDPESAPASELWLIVEKMDWMCGGRNPIPDPLPSINCVKEIRALLRELTMKNSLRPLKDRAGDAGGPRLLEETEHDEELSSQALATQAPAISYGSSDDDSLSVISQQFNEDSILQAPTEAHQQRRSESPQPLNAPPSSPPVQTGPLHPGWEGMTEVTARMAEIPEDQREELEKPGSWWPPTDLQDIAIYGNIPALKSVTNGAPWTQALPRSSSPPEKRPGTKSIGGSQESSEQSSDEEAVDWPPSPARAPKQLVELDRAALSPSPGLLSDAAEGLGQDPRPVSGAQGSQGSQGFADDSSDESSDNEATDCEAPKPDRKQIREELEAVPPSSARTPSPSPTEPPKQSFQPTSKYPDSPESTSNPPGKAIEEGPPRSEIPNRSPKLVPGLSIRRTALREDDLESRAKSSVETNAQSNKEPEADGKPGAGDSPKARTTPTNEPPTEIQDDVSDESTESMAHRSSHDVIESISKLERKSWCTRQTSTKADNKRAVRAGSAEHQGANKPLARRTRELGSGHRSVQQASLAPEDEGDSALPPSLPPSPHQRAPSEEPPFPVRDPNGRTPLDMYGVLGAQGVAEWRNNRKMAKLRKHLEGKFVFSSSADEEDGEAEEDVASDESGSGSQSELSDKDDTPRGHVAVKTSPRVVLSKHPRQGTPPSEEDEDVPCAPAKPSTGTRGCSRNAAGASGTGGHIGQPPSTAPNLRPVVQVEETPYRRPSGVVSRPIQGKVHPSEPHDADDEEMVPATARQPSSPAESGNGRAETLSVRQHSAWMPSELDLTPKGKGASAVGAKRNGGASSREDRQPHKKRRVEKIPKSVDFVSQEIRDIQSDISLRIEDEHRSFLAAQARRDSWPVSSTFARDTAGAGMRGRDGEGQPRPLMHTGGEVPSGGISAATKKLPVPPPPPSPLDPTPTAAKKARAGTTNTTPPPNTGRNPTAKMGKSPLLSPPPPPPPSVPQLPAGETERKLTEPPIRVPKAGASAPGGLYAGFRTRSLEVPGYEDLSEGQLKELERRRRRYFGTHRVVEPYIATAETRKGDAVARAAATTAMGQKKGSSRPSSNNDQWWRDEHTPMRQFVKKYKKLKSVRTEGT